MDRFIQLYGGAFLEGFFITLFLLMAVLFLGKFITLPQRPFQRELPRTGGVALLLGFLFTVSTLSFLSIPIEWITFFGVLIFLTLFGVIDDYKPLPWYVQLGVQIFALGILYVGGIHIFSLTHPAGGIWVVPNESILSVGFLLFLLWGVIVMNALNWLDGIDGLCGTIAFIVYSTFFTLALGEVVNQPPIAVVSAVLMGSTLAFLVYNFPGARVFAGTSGVLFFGLTITFLSVIAGTKIATALLVLILPILDAGFVLLKRLIRGVPVTARDNTHLHHILLQKGWSPRKIILLYAATTFIIAFVALSTSTIGKLVAISTSFILLGSLLFHFHFPSGKFRRWVFASAALALVIIGISFFVSNPIPRKVMVGEKIFLVEVVATDELRALGLSGRDGLCAECGMLFIFDKPGKYNFWMKNMQFSIDIIWFNEQKIVVGKSENLAYPSLIPVGPNEESSFVLEVPAGTSEGIRVGDKARFLY